MERIASSQPYQIDLWGLPWGVLEQKNMFLLTSIFEPIYWCLNRSFLLNLNSCKYQSINLHIVVGNQPFLSVIGLTLTSSLSRSLPYPLNFFHSSSVCLLHLKWLKETKDLQFILLYMERCKRSIYASPLKDVYMESQINYMLLRSKNQTRKAMVSHFLMSLPEGEKKKTLSFRKIQQ